MICSTFQAIRGMTLDKSRVCIGVPELAAARFLDDFFACTESFSNTTAGFYAISPVARQANSIFREVIPCHLAFVSAK